MWICNNNILTVAKHFPSKIILPLTFQSKMPKYETNLYYNIINADNERVCSI